MLFHYDGAKLDFTPTAVHEIALRAKGAAPGRGRCARSWKA